MTIPELTEYAILQRLFWDVFGAVRDEDYDGPAKLLASGLFPFV